MAERPGNAIHGHGAGNRVTFQTGWKSMGILIHGFPPTFLKDAQSTPKIPQHERPQQQTNNPAETTQKTHETTARKTQADRHRKNTTAEQKTSQKSKNTSKTTKTTRPRPDHHEKTRNQTPPTQEQPAADQQSSRNHPEKPREDSKKSTARPDRKTQADRHRKNTTAEQKTSPKEQIRDLRTSCTASGVFAGERRYSNEKVDRSIPFGLI